MFSRITGALTLLTLLVLALVVTIRADAPNATLPDGLSLRAEYRLSALEQEVAGIYPHPSRDGWFYVAVNAHPAYRPGQAPAMPERFRGKLVTVDGATGDVVNQIDLVNGDYGGLASDGKVLYVAHLNPPEILAVDAKRGRILRRMPVSGPVGGLEYDRRRGVLFAQLYVGLPHIAVLDPRTGATVDTLASDDNAMDLAQVGGELLCTWVSSFDEHAFGDLRRIDARTGKITGRLPLPGVHSSMAPLLSSERGAAGEFLALVRASDGRVSVRRYAYDGTKASW